jgi:hypothetical protein
MTLVKRKSCIIPMTLSSFIAVRPFLGPPKLPRVALSEACTTVSTFASEITLMIDGLRRSIGTIRRAPAVATAPGAAARRRRREHDRWWDRRRAGRQLAADEAARPGNQNRGRRHAASCARRDAENYFFSLRRCTRVFRSSLRCFFLDMRLRRFLITEPMLGLLAGRRHGCACIASIIGSHHWARQRARFGRPGYP